MTGILTGFVSFLANQVSCQVCLWMRSFAKYVSQLASGIIHCVNCNCSFARNCDSLAVYFLLGFLGLFFFFKFNLFSSKCLEAEQESEGKKKKLNLTFFVATNSAVKGKLAKMPCSRGGRGNPRRAPRAGLRSGLSCGYS